ncbi:MAG TPA: glycosyltransferase family 4 protein [Chthoniobacterales bacterium]|nr:glycosyltransferase family 4 protein [Chthoniobacterales bacterium]
MTQRNSVSQHRLIQIFNRYLEPGGEESWVKNLENTFDLPTLYFESADWTGPASPPIWSQALRMIYNPTAIRKLREFHEKQKPEAWIIQNAFPTGSAGIYREAERLGVPLIQYVHNFRPFSVSGYLQERDLCDLRAWPKTFMNEIQVGSWRNSPLRTAWFAIVLSIAHLLRRFDAITAWIAVSDFMRDQFIRAGVPAHKIFTLRHFWRPTADLSATSDQDYYLFIGRLVEMKGVLVLLDVWDRIFREQNTRGPKLVLVGDGELNEIVQSRAKENPLTDFRGSVRPEAKRELLGGMRALIAPSICLESLGLVAYEAYDFVKPVLAARSGGLGEIVLHEQTGLLHEPGNAEQLYQHVMQLEQDSNLRGRLGRTGREWLLLNADEAKWRSAFEQIVNFAIAQKGQS